MSEQVKETPNKRGARRTEAAPYRTLDQKTGGTLLSVAGMVILMGIITAEALMPAAAHYSTFASEISHLGGSDPPNSVILQPAATIFDATMILSGLMVVVGAYFVYRAFGRLSVSIPTALLGIGALGVGVFPAPTGGVHDLFSLLTFFVGGVAAILAYQVQTPPLRYVSVVLGAIPLLMLILIPFLVRALDPRWSWASVERNGG